MESGLDIKYLRTLIEDSDVSIERDIRHNLFYYQIEPMLLDNTYYEPEYYPYTLIHKNSNRPLKIRKVYPPVMCNSVKKINKKYRAEFRKVSKSKFMRFRKIKDAFGDELAQFRYKLTDASDMIEQVPMIKLMMVAHMSYDYLEYRIITAEEDDFDPRIEFRFWFYDEVSDSYSKEVIISVDYGILFGNDNLPIITNGPDHLIYDNDNNDDNKRANQKLIIIDLEISKTHLFHLLIKAFILITNLLEIDLQRANVNSYIAAIRGGIIYRLELDPDVDIDSLEYSLQDVKTRSGSKSKNWEVVRSMWIAENILDVLSTIKPKEDSINSKLVKRRPSLSELSDRNRKSKSNKLCQKRIAVPYSSYSILIKNLFESDTLLGITAGNTFLYIVDSLEVDNTGNLQIYFLNPVRGNTIKADIYCVLSGIRRIGLILDREIIHQLEKIKIN